MNKIKYSRGNPRISDRIKMMTCSHEWHYRPHPNGYFCFKCDGYIQNEGLNWENLPGRQILGKVL